MHNGCSASRYIPSHMQYIYRLFQFLFVLLFSLNVPDKFFKFCVVCQKFASKTILMCYRTLLVNAGAVLNFKL